MSNLHEASRDGDTERVQELLEGGDAPVNENEEDGMCPADLDPACAPLKWSPLMWASWEGRTDVVQLLLDKGALLDKQAKDGDTALMLASQKDHTEVSPNPNPNPNPIPNPNPSRRPSSSPSACPRTRASALKPSMPALPRAAT